MVWRIKHQSLRSNAPLEQCALCLSVPIMGKALRRMRNGGSGHVKDQTKKSLSFAFSAIMLASSYDPSDAKMQYIF